MSKSVRISESLHERIRAHKRSDETMEETIRRLIGGPHPDEVAGFLSAETATKIEQGLERKHEADVDAKEALRERFE